jgi:DnaD/phage-associated family protein
MTFAGFPARPQSTAIPNAFLSDVLPGLADDAAAVGVALYAFQALQAKRGSPRFVTEEELRSDPALTAYLSATGIGVDSVCRGLARAVGAGMLLTVTVEREGAQRALYFLNAPADRRGMESVRAGMVELGSVVAPPPAESSAPPGIFALYESLVGTLGPGIAQELTEAERLYPAAWLEEAFREAAAQNARSWRYVSRILERWASEGRGDAATERDPAGDDRYFRGKYGRILKQRLKG